jgi:hypothetical protein
VNGAAVVSWRVEGVSVDMHGSRGSWLFYVIAPGLLVGIAASVWLIVRGAWGLFGGGSDQEAGTRIRRKTPE